MYQAALARVLRWQGWEVTTANDGAEALAHCARLQPEVVIADFDMPLMNGGELAAMLYRAWGDEAPAIIIVSADVSRIGEVDQVRIVSKTLGIDAVIDAVDQAIGDTWVAELVAAG